MSITVSVVKSRAEAELIAGMLRNHGIRAGDEHEARKLLGGDIKFICQIP